MNIRRIRRLKKEPHVIIDKRLWQSSKKFAAAICMSGGYHSHLGIKGVICVAANVCVCYDHALSVLRLPALDRMDVPPEWFETAVQFYRGVGPVLVHCRAGLNRSSVFSAAIAYSCGAFETCEECFSLTRRVPHKSLVASLNRWAAWRADHGMDVLRNEER